MADNVNKETLAHLIKETDMVKVLGEYTKLEHHGALYTGHCPLCECNKNRFVVHPHRNVWRCFNCGKQGNVVDFLVEKECFNEVDAVKFLAEKAFDPKHAHIPQKPAAKQRLAETSAEEARPEETPAPVLAIDAAEPDAVEPDVRETVGGETGAGITDTGLTEFKPAENLFVLLRGVTGYKIAAVLADDLRVLAQDTAKKLDAKPLFSEFMAYFSEPLQGVKERCPDFMYTQGSQLTLRADDGALIVVSDNYEGHLVHLICLLSSNGNLVLTRRYMADLLAQQVFFT
jgi:hypothetical protein